MNKTAIKNFAVWARRKLISDITYKAGMLGLTEKGVAQPMQQSTSDLQFFDIGTKDYVEVSGAEIMQRKALVFAIREKEKTADYQTAFRSVIEEVAYTWFNRLIAIRFMEVNDYLPAHIRVLSSENPNKLEPDFVTNPFDTDLEFNPYEKDVILQMKEQNKLDELFRMLFIKQCNKLNGILPELFEQISDYTEILLTISFTDKDGVVYHLVHDISEDDFNVTQEGQVEIIGWLYQYYNTEPKDEVFALLEKNVKISKERLPAATQLFTPDWIVRYMVENSLGRLWVEGHPNENLKANWKYYLEESEQEPEVQKQLAKIHEEYAKMNPEDIKVIDPCMGSGHILVYAFDVLMQIYKSVGYGQSDATIRIIEHNLYGLDIDNRAFQMAYFAVMMKARQYNRRIFHSKYRPQIFSICESNRIDKDCLKYFGVGLSEKEKTVAFSQMTKLLDDFMDAKEFGSILTVKQYDWELLYRFVSGIENSGQLTLNTVGLDETAEQLKGLIAQGQVLTQKYHVVATNPPYLGGRKLNDSLLNYLTENYPNGKADLFAAFIIRCRDFNKPLGFRAMITQQAWMFLTSYEALRKDECQSEIVNMAQLGRRAFDEIGGEVVQTTTFVKLNARIDGYKGVYIRLTEIDGEKDKANHFFDLRARYVRSKDSFEKIKGAPIAYWASDRAYTLFERSKLLSDFVETKQGLKSSDDNRFFRLWPEVDYSRIEQNAITPELAKKSSKKWFPLNKGGRLKWYGDYWHLINWENDGKEIKEYAQKRYHSVTRTITSMEYYFRESISWPKITSNPVFRVVPEGYIFSDAGSAMFYNPEIKDYLLAFLNTSIVTPLTRMLNPTVNLGVGDMLKIPFVVEENEKTHVEKITEENIRISKEDWDSFEESRDFKKNVLIRNVKTISEAFDLWRRESEERFEVIKGNEEELNRIFIKIYGMQEELSSEIEDNRITIRKGDLKADIIRFISYAVGCMLGRYSLDVPGLAFAGGEWDDSKYKTFIPDADNCIPITDEEYFKDDIVGRFVEFVRVIYGEGTLEENLEFIATALGNGGKTPRETIRQYFIKDFFKDHCQTYSVTGSGKRPIYWLFDSGKQNGFKSLVYMHRWNADTVGNVRVEYLHKMQQVYEKEIASCQDVIDSDVSSREIAVATKRMEKLVKQLKECKDYDAKVAHIALSRINIDLDDGVKVNYRKVQTGSDGRFCEILADSKDIMVKEDSAIWQNLISNR